MKPEEDSAFGFRMMAEFLFAVASGKSEVKDKQAKIKQFLQVPPPTHNFMLVTHSQTEAILSHYAIAIWPALTYSADKGRNPEPSAGALVCHDGT